MSNLSKLSKFSLVILGAILAYFLFIFIKNPSPLSLLFSLIYGMPYLILFILNLLSPKFSPHARKIINYISIILIVLTVTFFIVGLRLLNNSNFP